MPAGGLHFLFPWQPSVQPIQILVQAGAMALVSVLVVGGFAIAAGAREYGAHVLPLSAVPDHFHSQILSKMQSVQKQSRRMESDGNGEAAHRRIKLYPLPSFPPGKEGCFFFAQSKSLRLTPEAFAG